ncbi:hypothetical protein Tco_1208641, partial [Tanacetum coccineum]
MANLPPPNHASNLPEDEPVHPEPALAAPEPAPPSLDHVLIFPPKNRSLSQP